MLFLLFHIDVPILSYQLFFLDKGMWASMVSLAQAVQRAVETSATSGGTPEALEAGHDLELALQRHRTTFISLLRTPQKNASERLVLV